MVNKPTKIIWHHSAVSSEQDQFKGIDNGHKKRGFPKSSLGFFVGYHYLIEHNGAIKQARKENEPGCHDRGENFRSIGICLSGNFSLNMPSERQTKAARRLVRQLMMKYNIPPERVEPHRWDDATECPGKLLPDDFLTPTDIAGDLNEIIRMLQEIIKKCRS